MYKKIGKFSFQGYSFISPIEEKFNTLANEIMNKFTFGIYKSFIEDNSLWDFDEKKQILDVLQSGEYIDLEGFEQNQALLILAQTLKVEMEEYLMVPLDEMDTEREKQSYITFNQFKHSDSYKFDINLELESAFNTNINQLDNIPEYFKLLRARNFILFTFSKRIYSDKTLSKFIERIFKSFKEDLTFLVISENINNLESKNIYNIADRVTKDYIRNFINYQQIGKTISQGESIVEELSEQIFSSDKYVPMLKGIASELEVNLHELLIESRYIEHSKRLIDYVEGYLKELTGVKESDLFILKYEDFKKIILGEIIAKWNNFDELLSIAYDKYTNQMIVDRILQCQKEYLSLSKFEIALRVSNLSVKNNLFYLPINEDIEAVSHELFKSWQYENYKELGQEKSTIIDIPEKDKENSMWFIIKNLDCANRDEEIAYLIAKEKLETYLEFYYYFNSKENEYKLKIEDPYILYNKTSKRISMGRKGSLNDRKYFDDFPKDLIKFPNEVLKSKNQLGVNLLQGIRLYYSTMNETNYLRKSQNLIDILKIIFDTNDYANLAKYAAVIIAGTNYNESDVTYGQMRQILYKDFLDFMHCMTSEYYTLFLEENFERFKVFTKNIIGTYLFNLSFKEENNSEDILKWILYINPNNEYIKSGVTKND